MNRLQWIIRSLKLTLSKNEWFYLIFIIRWKFLKPRLLLVIGLDNFLFEIFPFLIIDTCIIWNLMAIKFHCVFFKDFFVLVNSLIDQSIVRIFWHMIEENGHDWMTRLKFIHTRLSVKNSKDKKEIHHWLYCRLSDAVWLIRHYALNKHC